MPNLDLLRYWPRQEDVVACVKTDAEASSEAVALAVHQPMRFNRRLIGGDASLLTPCDEHELLRVFTQKNLPDGRVIVPIVGSSGIGKSHVVRWLYAQLLHMEGKDRRVVIRIPKGTSLKGVLGILLKDLKGPEYDQYRQELLRAQADLDVKESAGLLCEMLAQTIEGFGEEAKERLIQNPANRDAEEQSAFCRTDMLPTVLRNQVFRDQHFVRNLDGSDGVITRLVEQLTEGRVAGTEDDRQHQFTPEDLVFSDRIDRDGLGRAELRALSQLDREDRRVTATRILNAALDEAKQRLLRLDPTVSDLFNAVREQLLQEQKELVLLIEDFAVLSGIQKQLLQVVIKEAFRDGRQVLCTMRTALAYTTGYMDTATVLTRANVEYRIPDEPGSEEEILARIERLVGAYLNAARLGQSALEKAWESADRPENWIPRFEASVEHEARATLDEFHSSVDNYELFPFNAPAIRELSREGCTQQTGRLVFNPRFVIQNVINKVLVQRDIFELGQFPPAGFVSQGRPLPARVVEDVKRRVPIGELDRYLGFLAYWCGFPSALSEIGPIGSLVFQAFGLDKDRLSHGVNFPAPVPQMPRTASATQPSQKDSKQPLSDQDPTEAKWERLLDAWRGGHTLPQVEANQLRRWIADSLKLFVDWDWDLYRPLKDMDVKGTDIDSWREHIYIPGAGGHGGRTADDPLTMVAVCEDSVLQDSTASASIQSALMAVIRFHAVYKGNWDYAGAEVDMPRYAAFIEGIADRARAFVRRRYFKADWDPITTLVQGLLTGARVLGVEEATKDKNHASLIQALFVTIPPPTTPAAPTPDTNEDATGWTEFTDALLRCRRTGARELREQLSWQGHLLDLIGARQGQADTVHAINVLRLKPALESTVSSWEFNASLPNQAGASYSAFRSLYQEIKKLSTAVPKTQQRLRDWHDEMNAWIGDDFEKDNLYRELKETIEGARDAGIARGPDSRGLLELLDNFRNARVVPAMQDAARVEPGAPQGLVLTILGRDHQNAVRICQQLHTRLDNFLGVVEGELANEALRYGEDPVKDAVNSLTAEAKALNEMLESVESL